MIYARESYSLQLISDMQPLWKAHFNEISDSNYGPLNPNLALYEKSAPFIRIFTVRDEAGQLHGYQTFFIAEDPHSMGSIQAVQDILYLCPQFRLGLAGYRFIEWCGQQLESEGIDIIQQRISAKHNFGRILERMGYELEDLTYSRRTKKLVEVV